MGRTSGWQTKAKARMGTVYAVWREKTMFNVMSFFQYVAVGKKHLTIDSAVFQRLRMKKRNGPRDTIPLKPWEKKHNPVSELLKLQLACD